MSANVCQTCGLHKRSYETRAQAKAQARRNPQKPRRVYYCGPYWHLTTVTAASAAKLRGQAWPAS